MEKPSFRGKVVLVLGASGGIGAALVRRLLAADAQVIAAARSPERLAMLEREAGVSARLLTRPIDVRDCQQVVDLLSWVWERTGRIDLAIYCAGIEYLGPLKAISRAELEEMMATNFYGLFFLLQQLLPLMEQQQEKGTIVSVSSPMARLAFPWASAYAASKAAGDALLTGLRREYRRSGVRLLTIYPGPTATGAGQQLSPERLPRWHEHGTKMEAGRCAELLLRAVAAGQRQRVLAGSLRLLFLLERWLPSLSERICASMPLGEALT
ncbi:SDR family NAD(P)-dependent oxidoreductase [Thermogemmatispora carboxidivorans]|uniref:SDR family NAD(P)-dependent oxidoreductase n=1 Tax=Thermogemmatispora carboxidivorans TaxID=1382306 RepID=UPI0006992F71|nr:SDR family NAD(P)-dependent oxidoreductase [Thermogemmatispora carboxidivorans]